MTLPKYGLAPAAPDESILYGACRPRHPTVAPPNDTVEDWLTFVRKEGIVRVCCLLDAQHLGEYEDLLGDYVDEFGPEHICHAPIKDFRRINPATLHETVLPFLRESAEQDLPTVVHCSAGLGRTGHVLALWLAAERGYTLQSAVETVIESGRRPLEATTIDRLRDLLSEDETDDERDSDDEN